MVDDDVRPRLGRIRSKGGQSYLPRVLQAARKSGGVKSGGKAGSRGPSSRGRGAGIAAVTAGGRVRGPKGRRVIVKTRYTEFKGGAVRSARAHLRYLQRDGVTKEGQPGQLYDRSEDQINGRAFMDRSADDPRQFRFIVSAEDAEKYEDLKPLTRRFIAQMEKDLGTRLDWVAVDHYNTGHPHTHIVVRGQDEDGKDLVIARDYLSDAMRDRLEAIVTLDLGLRSDREIETSRRQEVTQGRFTSLDRALVDEMALDRTLPPQHPDHLDRALRVGRLNQLQAFGLAEDLGEGRWRLAENMESTLREMGERGDIIKSMHRELELKGMARAAEEGVIHRAQMADTPAREPLLGQVLKRGLLDGDTDRHFIMLDGVDGRVHWVDIGQGDRTKPFADDALVRIDFHVPEIRPADRTIVEVAASNKGSYDVAAHLNYDQSATEAFAETHARRLEAIRRSTGRVERTQKGAFRIDADYLNQALIYEQKRAYQVPANIEPVSPIPLSRLANYNGATWLDRELVESTGAIADAGFGAQVKWALRQRQVWLLQEELASEQTGQFKVVPNLLKRLETRDLSLAGARLEKASGLIYKCALSGDRVEGQLRQSITLPSGKYAMVEYGKQFTLVPWRSVLEDHLGKTVSGINRDNGINWTIGRGRGRGIS